MIRENEIPRLTVVIDGVTYIGYADRDKRTDKGANIWGIQAIWEDLAGDKNIGFANGSMEKLFEWDEKENYLYW